MANGCTLDAGARADDHPTTRRLRELAAQEAAVTKQRLATRTAAARLFFAALARLAEAKTAWGRAEAEVRRAQAQAVQDLIGSGLPLGEVAELLGISNRELRSLGTVTPARRTKASGPNEQVGGDRNANFLRVEPAAAVRIEPAGAVSSGSKVSRTDNARLSPVTT